MSNRKKFEKIFNTKNQDLDEDLDIDDQMYNNKKEKENMKNKYSNKNDKNKLKNFDSMQKEMQKYKGKKVSYEEFKKKDDDDEIDSEIDSDIGSDIDENEWEEENDSEEAQEEELQEEEVKEKMEFKSKLKNEKKDSNNNFEKTKELMDQDDEEYLKSISQFTPNEIRKGKNVNNQKNLFEFFIGIRIQLQKVLNSINLLPQKNLLRSFLDSENIHIFKLTIIDILKSLSLNLTFQREYLFKGNYFTSEQAQQVISNEYQNITKKIDQLINSINKTENPVEIEPVLDLLNPLFDKISDISEKIINIWYRKTLVYSYKSDSKILKILNNNFCEHIKTNLDSNYDVLKQKTQKKLNTDKILGKKVSSITEEFDVEVYNDNDFYSYLLKEFINNKEDSIAPEDNCSRYDLTLKYLMNRKNNNKKKVDTRASKNRKIRYQKHDKIINFTVPLGNLNINQGRNEIINSVFGLNIKPVEVKDQEDVLSDYEEDQIQII